MGVRVRQKGGAWWLFVCHEGQRRSRRVGSGPEGKKAAKTAAGKIEARLALGDMGIFEDRKDHIVPTFEAVAKEWEQLTSPNWKRGTQITYGNTLRSRILPTFGKLPITEITEKVIETWWVTLRGEHLSRKTLIRFRGILHGVCRRAVRLGLLKGNPSECIEGSLGRQDKEIRKGDYLHAEDLAHFLAVAERVCPNEYPIFQVMAMGGLRIGEAVGLQVGDLDVPGLQVHIRRAVRRGYVSSPKNGKGRVVDIPTSTVAVLARVREVRQVEGAYQGVEARWLFPGRTADMPITPEAVQQAFSKVLRAAGIRHIRPHDLRHTYATLAIQAGVPILTVSRQLGHASFGITVDGYTHAVPGSNRAAADAMETILSAQTHPPRTLPS